MATAIGGSPVTNDLVLNMVDEAGEPAKVTLPLDGSISDADLIAIVDNYIPLTNAFVAPQVVRKYDFTGYATAGRPIAALQSLVAATLALDFQKANPVNSAKSINRQVAIYAYINAIRNDAVRPHVPVTGNTNLNALIALLEDNLNYEGADGILYPGSWTYNPASKFGTKLTVTDGY